MSLIVTGVRDGNSFIESVTGFVLDVEHRLFWITAGHALRAIATLMSDSAAISQQNRMFLFSSPDLFVPLDGSFEALIWDDPDIACVPLDIPLADFIVRIVNEDRCFSLSLAEAPTDGAQVLGYCLLGMPSELFTSRKTGISTTTGTLLRCESPAACVPVERLKALPVDVSASMESSFAKGHNIFFGRILDAPNSKIVSDIAGMSGGPIISMLQVGPDTLGFGLIGVQSSWSPRHRIIRAVLFTRVIALLRHIMESDLHYLSAIENPLSILRTHLSLAELERVDSNELAAKEHLQMANKLMVSLDLPIDAKRAINSQCGALSDKVKAYFST
jgi:hypothetical protein